LADTAALPVIRKMPIAAQTVVRVLLVEDEPKLRASVAEGLSLEEWEVVSAATGQEAQHRLAAEHFDLVLLDWMLPDCDGLELVRDVRARGDNVPILMITARGGASAEAIVKQSGASDYLAKPFSFYDLLSRARALLYKAA
jgi:DNA-binding response OmpR family regulator